MRKLSPLAVIIMACLFTTRAMANDHGFDSAKTTHVIDGNVNEWKADKFELDKETQISYAVDHDASNLYLAIKVADQRMQMKMMMQGMNLFIDKKGKRKEGTGIEFPIKKENNGGGGGPRRIGGRPANGALTTQDDAPDLKEMRGRLATTMILLKTFGFDGKEDQQQVIAQTDGINVAFDWGADNNLYIEYAVPISFLGDQASLNGKPLGIGWKINGMAAPAVTTSSELVGVPAGGSTGRGGGNTRLAGASPSSSFGTTTDSRFRDQNIWTKYVLTF
jgi:hypothetical protein